MNREERAALIEQLQADKEATLADLAERRERRLAGEEPPEWRVLPAEKPKPEAPRMSMDDTIRTFARHAVQREMDAFADTLGDEVGRTQRALEDRVNSKLDGLLAEIGRLRAEVAAARPRGDALPSASGTMANGHAAH